MPDKMYCERCGQVVKRPTWLEFDQRTSTYTDQPVPVEYSQGFFAFGADCAEAELAEDKKAKEKANAAQ